MFVQKGVTSNPTLTSFILELISTLLIEERVVVFEVSKKYILHLEVISEIWDKRTDRTFYPIITPLYPKF